MKLNGKYLEEALNEEIAFDEVSKRIQKMKKTYQVPEEDKALYQTQDSKRKQKRFN